MDEKKMARFLRLAVIHQQMDAENLTRAEALDLLKGPLTPGDDSTIVDDSGLLDVDIDKLMIFLEDEKEQEITVYEIDEHSKYILIYPFRFPNEARVRLNEKIAEWMKSEERVLVLDAGPKLVKVNVDRMKKEFQAAQNE